MNNLLQEWRLSVPQPIVQEMSDVPFNLDLIPPGVFGDWIHDIVYRDAYSPSACVAIASTAISSVLAKRINIYPLKNNEEWVVIPNFWGGVIAPPGSRKTFLFKTLLEPIYRHQQGLNERFDEEMKGYDADKENLDKPIKERVFLSDATPEALQVALQGNDSCVLYARDELAGLLKDLERQYNSGFGKFLLEAWSGDGVYSQTRITREDVYLKDYAISILGTIQPTPFFDFLNKSNSDGDGFINRFQFLVKMLPPDIDDEHDEKPDLASKAGYAEVFQRIFSIPIGEKIVHFTDDAQKIFSEWRKSHQGKVVVEKNESLSQHFAKYFSLVPSLALVHEAIQNPDYRLNGVFRDVGSSSVNWAISITSYLELVTRQLYGDSGSSLAPEYVVAQKLLEKLRKRMNNNEVLVTERELKRSHKVKGDTSFVHEAILILEDLGYLFKETVVQRGGTKVFYHIHHSVS